MCDFFGITIESLPKILDSSFDPILIIHSSLLNVPITGILGDQQAALVGHLGIGSGSIKSTFGTGGFILFNTGQTKTKIKGLITTVAHKFKNQDVFYAIEGSIAIAGYAISWLRDNLGIISTPNDVNINAAKVKDTGGVYFVPAFSGLFAPYWDKNAKGIICGLTSFTNKNHICLAALESVCFQTCEILNEMKFTGAKLLVDGGMSNSDLMLQILSDLGGFDVYRPKMNEATSLGAALAAAQGLGIFETLTDFQGEAEFNVFKPRITRLDSQERMLGWRKAIQRTMI